MRYFACIFSLMALISSCKKPKPATRAIVVIFTSGNVIGKTETGDRKLKAGDLLYQGDTIITQQKSRAIVQFSSQSMARLDANTKVTIDSLQKASSTQIRSTSVKLLRGSIYSKIRRSNEAEQYQVKTPTVVAAVRGTEFITEAEEDGTGKVAVGDGTVSVANNEGESLDVEAGNKAVVDEEGGLDEEPLSEDETQELSTLAKIDQMKKENMQRIEELLEKQKELQKKASNIEGLNKQKDNNQELIQKQKDKNKQMLEDKKNELKDTHKNLQDKILEKKDDPAEKARKRIEELKKRKENLGD